MAIQFSNNAKPTPLVIEHDKLEAAKNAVAKIPAKNLAVKNLAEISQPKSEDRFFEILNEQVSGKESTAGKQTVTMRLDSDVIAWLKGSGMGWQGKMNRLLREIMARTSE